MNTSGGVRALISNSYGQFPMIRTQNSQISHLTQNSGREKKRKYSHIISVLKKIDKKINRKTSQNDEQATSPNQDYLQAITIS